jgi:hypothetical protein
VVPENREFPLFWSLESNLWVFLGRGVLITGIDSPVREASFTITVPVSKIESHGKL